MHDHAHEHRLEGDRRALAGALAIVGVFTVVGGNALVESGTFVAILLGTIAGGYLASLSSAPLMIGTVAVAIALFGFFASRFVQWPLQP